MKRIVLFLFLVFGVGLSADDISLKIGYSKIINDSFTYKGTKNYLKNDLNIKNLKLIGFNANLENQTKLPNINISYDYYFSSTKSNILPRNIIIDNTQFLANTNVDSSFYYHNISINGYYNLINHNEYVTSSKLSFGAGLYSIIGKLKINASTNIYTQENFKFYYPALFLNYKFRYYNITSGYKITGVVSSDHLYNLNLYAGYIFGDYSFYIGYNRNKLKIKDYDGWYSDIVTSGIFFKISRKF